MGHRMLLKMIRHDRLKQHVRRPGRQINAKDMRLVLAGELEFKRRTGLHREGGRLRFRMRFGMPEGELALAARVNQPGGETR